MALSESLKSIFHGPPKKKEEEEGKRKENVKDKHISCMKKEEGGEECD